MIYLIVFFAVSEIVYGIAEKRGFFFSPPACLQAVLYSLPFIVISTVVLILLFFLSIRNRKGTRVFHLVQLAALLLIVFGLWIGHFEGFGATIVLTEGQSFYSGHDRFSVTYKGRFAKSPEIALKLDKLVPEFSNNGKYLNSLNATVRFYKKGKKGASKYKLGSFPHLIDGRFYWINGLGYSPEVVLTTKDGRVLQDTFIYMRLYPFGEEDFFRFLSPLTYYVRYLPFSGDKNKAFLKLRIARNKDILINKKVRFGEKVHIENAVLQFKEIKPWTRLYIMDDYGPMFIFAGVFLLVLSFFIWIANQIISFHKKQSNN